jgi:hypothetical protein
VISTGELKDLIARVNEHIRDGWRLQGGVAVTTQWISYNQAMVRGFNEAED